jgi:hypothetical protein
MKKLKLLLFTLFCSGLMLGVLAQDTIRSLIISEWRGGPMYDNYIEFANVGTDTLDLSRFSLTWVNGGSGQFEVVDGQWFVTAGFNAATGNYTLSGTLAPGETYLIMNVGDALGNDGMPWHNVDLIERADHIVHVSDTWGYHDQAIPEWEIWGKDSIDNQQRQLIFNWGTHANVLFYHLNDEDSVLIDGVNVYVDDDLHMIKEANDVAGVPEATATHTLVRKANVLQGNMNWKKSKGVDLTDSEWIPIPSTYEGTSFTTAGVHGDFGIDMESGVVDIDKNNAKLTVPWGIYKRDSILKRMTLGPGLGWQYVESPSIIDSAHSIIQNGDVLRIYATGNELERIDFEIIVADAAPDQATVFPMLYKADNIPIIDTWGYNAIVVDGYWIPHYYVTVGQPGMDTIGNVPYATRVDTLYKNLEKAPEAKWDIIWHNDTVRADLQKGDILKVTSEDESVVKEYYIDVQEYAPGGNALLGAITWPDGPEYIGEGWAGDTIPQFSPSKTSYAVTIPYGTVNVPALAAHPQDINSMVETQRAVSLSGSQADRSTVFTVTSEGGTLSEEYTVIFELEKDPARIQLYEGTPFISEIATNQRSWIGWLEIVNPGNVDMHLDEYLIVRSTEVNPGDALKSLVADEGEPGLEDDFKNRYRSYAPGYKYYEDTTNWVLNPGILSIDADVEPVVEPGGVFVISMANAGRAEFYTAEQLAMIDKKWTSEDGMGVNVAQTVACLPRAANAVYLFKIENDSVFEGTKPVGDPADYELVDVLGDPVADAAWSIAGTNVPSAYRGRIRTKPHVYTGARSLVESNERFGTNADDSDWTVETFNVDFSSQDDIPAYIGAHVMDPVTIYLSTVSSAVYLVSDGYAGVQTIQGDLTSTSVEVFYGNIDEADPGQVRNVLSGTDGSVKDAADPVAGSDTLVVVSADGMNTTKYALVDLPLDSNASLTTVDDPSDLTIVIDGSVGTITGVVYGGLLKEVTAAVKTVSEHAVMNIIDGDGNLVPLQITNYNAEKVDTKVGDDIYFEVVAQDRVTVITYKLEPASLSSDAFVISSIYEVDQENNAIAGLAEGTSTTLFFMNIEVVKDATANLLSKLGHERVDGIVSHDDVLKVVSEDGSFTRTYFLTFLNESSPDANNAPLVTLAFSDTTLTDPGTIRVSATATDDNLPPPPMLTTLWKVTSGNASDVEIANDDQLETDVTFNAKGNYILTVSVSDGALTTQEAVNVFIGDVGMDMILTPAMHIYPNPATDKLTLELVNMTGNHTVLSIYSITGRAVFNAELTRDKTEIDISDYDAGLYFIKVNAGDHAFTHRVQILD